MLVSKPVDLSIPFILPRFSMRGRLVRLQDVSTTILNQHAYPYPVAKILADSLAAGAALAGLLKYEGVFTLQTKTSGPLHLMVVDITNKGHMRGYAQARQKEIGEKTTFKDLLGKGYLAFTVDQGLKIDRYQGIVSLDQDTLPHALEHYFDQSEQLETRLFIMSHTINGTLWKSGALLLQQMPTQKVKEDAWTYMESLFHTLTKEEFLDFTIPYETFLYRLFHEGSLAIFEPLSLKARCRCSKDRIKAFLASLTPEEIESLLENGRLKMTCEFCNHHYEFDRKDLITLH